MLSLKKIAVLLLLSGLLYGCGGTPVPTNDLTEREISDNVTAIVAKKGYATPLSPEKYVEVLNLACEKAGYSYSATLEKIAENGFSLTNTSPTNQAEYRAAMFMIMPARLITENSKSKEESLELLAKIYSSNDVKSVAEIMRMGGSKFFK